MDGARQPSIEHHVEGLNWGMVAVAGAMSFVVMADGNVATVVAPSMMDAFHVSAAAASLVLVAYQIPAAALLLFFGSLFASINTRIAVPITIIVFTVAGTLCALADSMPWLIAARVVQGVSAAALSVQMPLLAATAAPPGFLARAMSVPAISGPLGAAVGAGAGGLIAAHFGYRSVFLLHIPVCVLVITLFATASRARPDHRSPAVAQFNWPREVTGVVVSATGITLFLFAIAGLEHGVSVLVTAMAGVALVVVWARVWGRDQGQVLQRTTTRSIHLGILLLALGLFVLTYTVSVTMQSTGNQMGADGTGMAMMAFPLAMAAAGLAGGSLADRFSATTVACVGSGIVGVAMLFFLTMPSVWTPAEVGWRLALAGVGMGLYGGPTQALVFTRAGTGNERATLSGTTMLARHVGFAAGPACAVGAMSFGAPAVPVLLAAAAACAGTVALVVSGTRRGAATCVG